MEFEKFFEKHYPKTDWHPVERIGVVNTMLTFRAWATERIKELKAEKQRYEERQDKAISDGVPSETIERLEANINRCIGQISLLEEIVEVKGRHSSQV